MTTPRSSEPTERLNKYLALQLGISRREADNLIAVGSVRINEAIATLGARFSADDTITVKGKPVTQMVERLYMVFNKPIGYVCSRRAQGSAPTIYEILPLKYHTLKPAGRLDKDSSGLLLLTNDGDFAYQLTHPKFQKVKEYLVTLDTDLAPLHHQMIADIGVHLEDGVSRFQLERTSEGDNKNWLVTMSEGRNRQIRRTFAALGYTVTALHRTKFGNYALGDIPPGKFQSVNLG